MRLELIVAEGKQKLVKVCTEVSESKDLIGTERTGKLGTKCSGMERTEMKELKRPVKSW